MNTSNVQSFEVDYDRASDVLYITQMRSVSTKGVEDRNGIVWRYDVNGALIGATLTDFFDRWHEDRSNLAIELAERFQISAPQATRDWAARSSSSS